VFTDSKNHVRKNHFERGEYVVSPHIRVRKEEFGLLFYDTQNAKLTFVKSGDIFQIERLPLGKKIVSIAHGASIHGLRKTLDNLVNKGLIFEA
jgi:putative mycofactocin binding protein MftB